ncbi:helix-turn-helix domain-containing protein [Phyllobacterium sp. NPDC097923]|uniref:helix-turn-helix domain-containing protein n=1 Tax=Phyllobacterium sp. NPDC097923 TaxID=3364404 RepID=UPI00383A90E0
MENVRGILARNVRLGRQQLHLSQEELAAQANIDRTYISGIERETRNPTITIVAKIAEVLGTTAAALLTNQSKTTER